MITITIKCRYCGSEDLVKNGHNPDNRQRCLCRNCGKTFQIEYLYNACRKNVKEKIMIMSHNGNGIRYTARVLKINSKTVMAELRKNNIHSDKSKLHISAH